MRTILLFILIFGILENSYASDKIGHHLKILLQNTENDKPLKLWVYFTDKGNNLNRFYTNPQLVVSEKSIERRKKVLPLNSLIDYDDLPVNEIYVDLIKSKVLEIKHKSKWFNAISVIVLPSQIEDLINLPFVKKVELVERFRKKTEPVQEDFNFDSGLKNQEQYNPEIITAFNYGQSLTQNQQINVVAVHNSGNYGQGVRICLMDAGFNRLTHEVFQNMNIIATWDFVNGRPYVGDGQGGMGEGSHGTQTLSTIGGFKEGQLIGPAFGATYILAKTENTESETPIEMDNWIAALEWADSIGVDVTSTSLGYLEFDPPYPSYNWTHMDGNTVPITIAADLAVKRGIVVVNSAGNEGYNSTRNTLVAPADGDSVIAVGAVTSSGARASFSSVGNTVDGRIKPDVMAMGSGVRVASPYSDNGYTSSSGTSFSCPLAAGVAALILSENPSLNPMQVREAMRNTASNSSSPNREMGWGILNAYQAVNYYNIVFSHSSPTDSTNVNGPYRIVAKITSRLGIDPASVKLFWGRGSITDSIQMMEAPGDTFYAFIPGNGQSVVYKYYLEAKTADGQIFKRFPRRAPQELLEFRVGNFVSVNVSNGWNLMSVPVINSNIKISDIFSNRQSQAYYYDGRYVVNDTIFPGYGFWLKFQSQANYSIPGQPLTGITIPVKSGWNLIGSLNNNLPVYAIASDPPNNILTPFYGYSGGYFNSPQLERGKGYWVKVAQDGYLILNPTFKSTYDRCLQWNLSQIDKLIFNDADGNSTELYLSNVDFDNDLPPVPPSGAFDIRFIDSKISTMKEEDYISLQNVKLPLHISLDSKNDIIVELEDFTKSNRTEVIKSGEVVKINALNSDLLKVKINKKIYDFSLYQNYPNPFNSMTTIKFQIPNKEKITLKLLDILGREIKTVVSKEFEPGIHTITIDLNENQNLVSGIYFYQIISKNYIETKKMIYLK